MEDMKINVKIKLAGLWASVMFLYVYGDILGIMKPGHIEELIAGKGVGDIQITQVVLLGIAILMVIPSVMIILSLLLKPKVNRWVNIILGIVYTLVMIGTMIMPGAWAYYIFLGIVEIILTLLIAWYAWKWPKREA